MKLPVPNAGEPLLTCFDCQRARTLEQLTLFPWWDERVNEFDAVYRCDQCLPRAHRQILKQLAKNGVMLSSFVDFASQVLNKLIAHEVFVQNLLR